MGGWGAGCRDFATALDRFREMGEDIGLSYHKLFALWKQESGNVLEFGGQKVARSVQDINKAKEGGLVECLNSLHNLLTILTLLAEKEDGKVGVCGH